MRHPIIDLTVEPNDRPAGRVQQIDGEPVAFLDLDQSARAYLVRPDALYLRRLAAEADRLADALDAHAAQAGADIERMKRELAGRTVQPADPELRPTRAPRNQGVPELNEHVWQAFQTGEAFDIHPVAEIDALAVKLAAQKSARYLSRVHSTDVRVTVDRIAVEPGVVRVRVKAHPPLRKGRAVTP